MFDRASAGLVALLAAGALAGCGSKDQVILTAKVENVTLTVDETPLTTELTGGFDIVLSLGDRAADPSTVGLGTFSLLRGDQVLLSPLHLDDDPDFPVEVGVGKTVRVAMTLAGGAGEPELAAELCAENLVISGSITDSLTDDRPRTLASGPFPPDCL